MHYTLQSGQDTTTCTFKCLGCGVRYPHEKLKALDLVSTSLTHKEVFLLDFNITGCSQLCLQKAASNLLQKVRDATDYELLEDVLCNMGYDSKFLLDLVKECRTGIGYMPYNTYRKGRR
jgi:hypothetical protein